MVARPPSTTALLFAMKFSTDAAAPSSTAGGSPSRTASSLGMVETLLTPAALSSAAASSRWRTAHSPRTAHSWLRRRPVYGWQFCVDSEWRVLWKRDAALQRPRQLGDCRLA